MPAQMLVAPRNRLLLPPVADFAVPETGSGMFALEGEAFGTGWRIDVVGPPGGAWLSDLRQRCLAVLEMIDAQMSPWRADSDLARFNRAAPGAKVRLPEPMRSVVAGAIAIAELSDGAFDPTLHDATALWGFGAKAVAEALPDADMIAAMQAGRRDWRHLRLDGECLEGVHGLALDLCAIAKGYAVDAVMVELRRTSEARAGLVEIGGELKGWNVRPDCAPWWVAVEGAERTDGGQTLAALCDWAVATSGVARRHFVADGTLYSHMIDPETLAPTRSGALSVTVFDPQCWRADALATALAVMERGAAQTLARKYGIACLMIHAAADGEDGEWLSPALVQWLDDDQ